MKNFEFGNFTLFIIILFKERVNLLMKKVDTRSGYKKLSIYYYLYKQQI